MNRKDGVLSLNAVDIDRVEPTDEDLPSPLQWNDKLMAEAGLEKAPIAQDYEERYTSASNRSSNVAWCG